MGFGRGLLWVGVVVCAAGRLEAQRLPGGVTPEHYALTITPNLAAATFKGTETIDVVLEKPTDAITLNAAEIEFGEVEVAPGTAANPETPGAWTPATVTLNATDQQATIHLPKAMASGPATLKITYSGVMTDKLRGFYISRTKTRSYGVTQFEATDARRAFPSFDEPALKATFDVSVVVDTGDTGISNGPIISDKMGPVDGKHTLRFATTPKMSTYLVAWLVGDWECTEGKSEDVPIRACATPDKVGLTKFALEAAKWDLKYYDKYFGIKYPMQKMDLIAVPDFEAGAMENFGCLTFRETEMLVDEKNGAIAAKKEVAETVAHEISHQWFGDMVTMQWWDNLWLNEGFATWMESKAAAKWHPEWKYEQDVAGDLDETMDLDSQATTRAIRTRAETPAEIDEMFDGIAYGKAGAVVGMVENWVGEEVFRKGVQEYLQAHMYGTATAEDFWGTQTRVSGLPVDQVLRSFVEQPGVPVITLTDATPSGVVPVVQERFLLADGAVVSESDVDAEGDERWTVPLCFKDAGCKVLEPGMDSLNAGGKGLLFANEANKGYYRTSYSAKQMAAIEAGAETELTAPERIGLLSDRWALMRGGMGSVGEFLDLAIAVKSDPNAAVLDNALGKIGSVGKLIAADEDRERLNAVVRREFGPVYAAMGTGKHQGWDREELRSTLYEALGNAGDPEVLAEAHKVTEELFSGHRPADVAVADASVALAAQKGDAQMYDRMLSVAKNATDPGLKEDALHLLTRFEEPLLVIRTLEYAVSDEVKSQDSWILIALLLGDRATQDLTWQFVEQHWTAVSRKMTVNSGARIVEAAGSFCSAGKRDEVAQFFSTHPVASERTLSKTLESIDGCVHLRAAQEPELRRWLDGHK